MQWDRDVTHGETFAQFLMQVYPEQAENDHVRECSLTEFRRLGILLNRPRLEPERWDQVGYLPGNCPTCSKVLIGWWKIGKDSYVHGIDPYVHGRCRSCVGHDNVRYLSTVTAPAVHPDIPRQMRLQPDHYWNPYFVAAAVTSENESWDALPDRLLGDSPNMIHVNMTWTPPINHLLRFTLERLAALQPMNPQELETV